MVGVLTLAMIFLSSISLTLAKSSSGETGFCINTELPSSTLPSAKMSLEYPLKKTAFRLGRTILIS